MIRAQRSRRFPVTQAQRDQIDREVADNVIASERADHILGIADENESPQAAAPAKVLNEADERSAMRLANCIELYRAKVVTFDIARLSDLSWRLLASAAEVPPPSLLVRARVIELLLKEVRGGN